MGGKDRGTAGVQNPGGGEKGRGFIALCFEEGVSWEIRKGYHIFLEDIKELDAKIQPLFPEDVYNVAKNAQNSILRIKHHARDFIIGTQAEAAKAFLITQNIRHFNWLPKNRVLTPDEFTNLYSV